MTREEARKAAEIMLAYAEGKEIEYRNHLSDKWLRSIHPKFNWEHAEYRVKKKLITYRPFKSKEECWAEMKKHQPFGWVMARGAYRQVLTICYDYICFAGLTVKYDEAFNEAQFADGIPFGKKEG